MDQQQLLTPLNKKRIILAAIGIFLIFLVYWLSTHAFIEVIVSNSASGDVDFSLYDQRTQQTDKSVARGTKIKKLVRKGTYEVLVKQGGKSYFALAKVGGFLGTTSLESSLEAERQRTFVGNNPLPCMHYDNNRLVTYTCRGQTDQLQVHKPATKDLPTLVQKSPDSLEGNLEDVFTLQNKSYVLIREPEQTISQGDPGSDYFAYPLRSDLALNDQEGIALPDLTSNGGRRYTARSFGNGVLFYDDAYRRALQYDALNQEPKKVSLADPNDTTLRPYTLTSDGKNVGVMFAGDPDDTALENDHAEKQKSEFVISGDQEKHFPLNKRYSSIALCGTSKLCGLFDDKMDVFDINGDKASLLYVVSRVNGLESLGNGGLLLIREGEVMNFDADNRSGSVHYTLGEYTTCGFEIGSQGYVLCLINHQQRKVALSIDASREDTDSIDKKISELLKISEIKEVSIYGNVIYISPELGQVSFIEETGEYGFSPNTIRRAADAINRKVDSTGIDRSKYTIINTFAN